MAANDPSTASAEAPTLFDLPKLRDIPVGSVRQSVYVPEPEADEPDDDTPVAVKEPQAARRPTGGTKTSKPPREAAARPGKSVPAPSGRTQKPATKPPTEPVQVAPPAKPAKPAAAPVTTEPAAAEPDALEPAADESPAPRASSRTPKHRGPVTAEMLASQQREISVSEFFAKNRHLLGFDNKRKALLTTVKEAVDNSLDACEEAHILPELDITIDQLAEDRFRVTVRDNGPGIVKGQIANIFGKLLYGSKFHRLKMARGQQGIGISAAGMYGLITTGKSVLITSRTSPKKEAHYLEIQMDTAKNKADVIKDEPIEVPWERGTEVTIELVATYTKGRQSVDEYIEQTAIANPHALIRYRAPTAEHREFPRATQDLPAETREIKPHPYGIELGVLMKMLKEAKGVKLAGFLQREFSRVSSSGAAAICERAVLSPKAPPAQIGTHEVEKLYEAMQSVKIMAPPTDCLAPIGIRNLLAGLLKEVKAEFYTATTRDPAVYRGNPFQIEIAIAYGGKLSGDEPARVIRFANRVPLLYQQSACAAYKSVLDVDWRNYSLSQPSGSLPVGPLVVMVHMASVWVPFTSESKEAIADYDEIRKEMKLALQECGRKLAAYVRRRRRQRLEGERRNIFERYIPDVADALANLTGGNPQRLMKQLHTIARSRTAEADVELDEDGRPVAAANGSAEAEDLDDASTVIVPENETTPVADDLFENGSSGQNGGAPPRRRRRKS